MNTTHSCSINADRQGFSTLEFFITLGLSSLLLSCLMLCVQHSLAFLYFSKQKNSEQQISAKLTQLMHDIEREQNLHRLPISARIQSAGEILYADGTKNPLSQRMDSLAPKKNSNAISSFELIMRSYLQVIHAKSSGVETNYLACPLYALPLRAQHPWLHRDTESFLGLSVDGPVELIGRASKAAKINCYDLALRPAAKSMIVSSYPGMNPLFVRAIIPIRRNYTLYLDRGERLRFVSHRGVKNTELQPLVSSIQQISFIRSPAFAGKTTILGMKFTFKGRALPEKYAIFSLTPSTTIQTLVSLQ